MTEALDITVHNAVLDAAPDAIVVSDASGVIVLANSEAERLFGYARAGLIGQTIEMLIPESARESHRDHRIRYLGDPRPRPMGAGFQFAGRRFDDTEFPAEISLSAIHTPRGVLVAAVVRDASERKRAEATSRGLLEAAPDAIVGIRKSGRIALVNARAEALFGYERGELVGQPVEILVPEAARGVHSSHRAGYLADPRPRPMGAGMELAGRRKDGSEFPAEISLSAIETDEGLLISAAIRDGTARKQAAIVSSSNDAIISQSLDGTITTWNPGATRLYGYDASEVLGQNIEILIPDEHRERERAVLVRAAEGEGTKEYETVRVRADGKLIDIARSASPVLDSTGRVIGVSTIAHDISERIQATKERAALEERLNQSQRLESLGQLAGGIAHDFNNLLAVILNYASFVAEEVAGNAAVSADVDQIRIAADRAAGLTRQLLIFGRRETIQLEILDLNAVVSEIETLLSRTIGEHVELVVQRATELPMLKADRGQLEQVLVNLAVNARDAMPEGGTLTIETDEVELDEEGSQFRPNLRAGHYLTLSVSDTGTGMSAEVIARAFEPFFTTKARGEGSGLGLATVYGIVTQSGGTVILYSEGGFGTTVRVYLPSTDQSPTLPSKAAAMTMGIKGNGETILVVEDEAAMREVALRILRRNGYKVLGAATGQEALTIITGESCDLLLTDVIMPHMLGRELVERVHEIRPTLPVLYMSGYSQGVLGPQRALGEEVELIQKPFTERALIEKVGSILGR